MSQPLEHWDGSTWSSFTNPNGATLQSVSVTSPTDAWATGYLHQGRRTELTVAMHWDGQSWTVAPTVDPHYRHNILWGVSTLPSGKAWAVGTWGDERTLVEQWDGSAWIKVDAPSPKYYSDLHAVSAEADDDVWAVGQQGSSATPDNLVEHWDGNRWSRVATPKPGEYAELWGVSADAPDDAWAVGFVNYPGDADSHPWLQHWDGDHWTRA